jgi:hypothetical protein
MTQGEVLQKASGLALQHGVVCAGVVSTPTGFHLEFVEANPKNPARPRRKGMALNSGDPAAVAAQQPEGDGDAALAALIALAASSINKPAFAKRG